jgi:hypothetical protein
MSEATMSQSIKLWQPIDTAPRDGRVIVVTDHETFTGSMAWNASGTNPPFQRGVGIWEATDRSFTWSEERGAGPTHWRPTT